MANEEKIIPVIVAVRARPLSAKEIDEGSTTCLDFFVENGQVNINSKPFYFDHVFDSSSKQESVYDMCAEPLIGKLFEGYNCTIFAYGQTGSGKTFTMGTECCDFAVDSDRKGMIPRIVEAIFAKVDSDDDSEIMVKCSMLEIYEERVLDLLSDKSEKPELFIREHPQEGIFVQNLCQVEVGGCHQTMQQLAQGCLSRTKGGTAMNSESSRSHAIFTIFVKKSLKSDSETRSCYSKLHLVDLAGSERLKKTQAQGERKKEGIKINEGLLALGNVISALTDSTQQRSHIPYRDSKLTRLLQDSLGGNTYTVMITCVSPADSNYDETLNSLRYAERAKKIKNKPTVNEDPNAREICDLRKKLDEMQKQLLEYQLRNRLDSQAPHFDSSASIKFKQEIDNLKSDKVNLSDRLTQMVVENGSLIEKIARTECQRDKLKEKLSELQQNFDTNVTQLANQFTNNNLDDPTVRIAQNEHLKAYIEKCKDVQMKLQDLQNDEALLLQEASFDKENEENDEEFDEEKFVSRHSAASKQLEHLLKQITDKEKLIKDSAMNMEQFEQLKADHQREIGDLKEKIDAVHKEKKELESQLVTVGKTSKISENRRKKMAELEKQLTDYKKKLQELQKFEKMKQQNDQAILKMKEEVTALKQQRVQLTRQLRVDKQRFTEWQTKTEKQMNQMKVKEKRREYEAVLAKRNFDQQLNVHRRKYEEAVALSKRLQVQLQRQNNAKKNQFSEGQETDKLRNEIKDFLEKEIELLASTEEAKLCCDNLLKQRSNLNQQLKSYERQFNRLLKNPMKIADEENAKSDYVHAEHLQEKIESLRKEVLLRTNEIQELRQKISSLDAAQMEEKRWNSLNTLVQAKCAMKTLFSMAVAFRTEYLQIDHQLADLHANFDLSNDVMKEKDKKVNDLERQCAESERANENRFNKLNIEHNNRIASFLCIFSKLQSGQPLDDEMKKLMQLCGEEAEKLQILTEQLDEKDLENEKLTKELSKVKVRGAAHGRYFQHMSSTRKRKSSDRQKIENNFIKSRSSRVIKRPARFGSFADPENLSAVMDDSVVEGNVDDGTSSTENRSPSTVAALAYIDDDDDVADEDYRETPIHKQKTRIFTFNEAPIVPKMKKVNDEDEAPSRKKSKSNAGSCNCKKGRCATHLCGCVKRNGLCGETCTCSSILCENRTMKFFGVKFEDENAPTASKEKAVDDKLFAPTENFLNSTFVTAATSSSLNVDSAAADFMKTSTPNNAPTSTERLEAPFSTIPAVAERDQTTRFAKPAVPTRQILMRGLTAPNSYTKFSPNRKVPLFKSLTPSVERKK